MAGNNRYDVFLSHAVEDKAALADPLNKALTALGIRVWYSGDELFAGDLLIQKIREGLAACNIAIVIISPSYLDKIWTQSEFDHFIEKQTGTRKVILPILLDITPPELAAKSLVMANIWALRAEIGVDKLATKLCTEIKKDRTARCWRRILKGLKIATFIIGFAVSLIAVYPSVDLTGSPEDHLIKESIAARKSSLTAKANVTISQWAANKSAVPISAEEAAMIFTRHKERKSKYRNEYVLEAGLSVARSKKKVEEALVLDMDVLSPLNAFALDSFKIFHFRYGDGAVKKIDQLLYINLRATQDTIQSSVSFRGKNEVDVRYFNMLRTIEVTMIGAMRPTDVQRYSVEIVAFHPHEIYLFSRNADKWVLESVRPGK
jgi:hypothetical protein